jgi:hypothetical protein
VYLLLITFILQSLGLGSSYGTFQAALQAAQTARLIPAGLGNAAPPQEDRPTEK